MDRGASSEVITQIGAQANEPCHLFEMYFDDQTARATDAYRSLGWNGNVYGAAGTLISFDGLDESSSLEITQVTITVTGVLQDYLALLLSRNYIDRRIVIYKAFISGAGVVVNPIPIFDGRADSPSIDEDPSNGSCTVKLVAAQHWVDFERRPGRHTNDAEEQIYFPGDRGFNFVSSLNKEIKWGRS